MSPGATRVATREVSCWRKAAGLLVDATALGVTPQAGTLVLSPGTWGQGRAHGWTHGTTAEEKLGQSRARHSLSLRVIIGLIKKQLIIILAH